MISDSLRQNIACLYGMPAVKFSSKVTGGFLSTNFILENEGERFFLKQYRQKEEGRIREIHAAKAFFAAGGIPVILPLQALDASTFFAAEGSFYALFPFVAGTQLPRQGLSPENWRNMGEMLARIHIRGRAGYPKVKSRNKPFDHQKFLEKLSRMMPLIEAANAKGPSEFDRLALESVRLKRELVEGNVALEEALPLPGDHLIHGDYHTGNIFFDDSGHVSHVFDWEKTEVASRVFELIRSLDYSCFEGGFGKREFENARAYFQAYSAHYPLAEGQLEKGIREYYLNKIQSLWIEAAHYLEGHGRVDHFLKNELDMIVYLKENSSDFVKKLL